MSKTDHNKLGMEKRGGPMNELVSIRYDLIDTAASKAEAAAFAMDHSVISEMALAASMETASMPELLQAEDSAAVQAASVSTINGMGSFPLQQLTAETNMLTENDQQTPDYIDRMAAEARVEQSFTETPDMRNTYDNATA